MRILHVVQFFAPAWAFGGPPRAVYEIATRQARAGHQVTVLTTDAFERARRLPAGVFTIDGITVIRLRNLSNFLMWNIHFCTPLPLFSNATVDDFEVIHLHEVRTLLNLWVLRGLKSTRMVVLSPWGSMLHNNRLIAAKQLFDQFSLSLIRSKVCLSLGQNQHEVNALKQWRIGRHQVIVPLGIDFSYFSNMPGKYESRNALGINTTSFIFLFLGRFAYVKGIRRLIKSFSELYRLNAQCRLLLVGRDDGDLNEIKKTISSLSLADCVTIIDPLYGDHRKLAYAAADAFVYTPTVYEETSTACLEALASGIPVITTREAEIPYLGVNEGVLQVDNRPEAIVRAMEEVAQRKVDGVDRSKVARYFDWSALTQTLDRIYAGKLDTVETQTS